MSSRSTPVASRVGSFSHSHEVYSPTSSFRPNRLPSLAENASSSGTGRSTPIYRKRRAQRTANGHGGNGHGTPLGNDWADMEPDEVFRRLPVNDVKRVESKMRSDASNKQAELRAMVGTRYRDLLTSATQITSLRSSSLHLSSSLKIISKSCSNPSAATVSEDDQVDAAEAEDVMNILPAAAHLKLLLDAPEALYSYLSHHAYLNAAYLWLVSRVVKEGLATMPEDLSGPYLPLLQKQWEVLLPFRSQIVTRATASLRARDKLDVKAAAESLLAIILLDNLPMSDALTLLLSQRTKTLRDILDHPHDLPKTLSSSANLSPAKRVRKRRTSKTAHASDREAISEVLADAISCLSDTVNLARAVFDVRKRTGDGESLLEELVRLVQKGEPLPQTTGPPPVRRTSHERRTSRLASISLPLPKASISGASPPVSAQVVIQPLPSSQILLRHLPASIINFTPFITPSPAPSLDQTLNAWQASSVALLVEAIPGWLHDLDSISDIWQLRAGLLQLFNQEDGFKQQIKESLEGQWAVRVREVWSARLKNIVDAARTGVKSGIEALRDSGSEEDSDPGAFRFSNLPFPSVSTTAIGSSTSTTLTDLTSAVALRSAGRTPQLDRVLQSLESAAATLKLDLAPLSESLLAEYSDVVGDTLQQLVAVLEECLASAQESKDGQRAVTVSLFVGRVAVYMAKSSTFLEDLTRGQDIATDTCTASLLKVHSNSTTLWQRTSVDTAVRKVLPVFAARFGPAQIKATWQGPHPTQPSSPVMVALQSLVSATRALGIPSGAKLDTVSKLVTAFVDRVQALDEWKSRQKEAAVQAAFDLAFLNLIKGGTATDQGSSSASQSLLSDLPEGVPADFADRLPLLLADSLRRTQFLLHPLLVHLPTSAIAAPTPKPQSSSRFSNDRLAGILRFGAPDPTIASGPEGEFRSLIPVAKPGKRFGLLSVVA